MTSRLDLNADVGESFGAFTIGSDAGLMRSITSANIAAGFHGGDPSVARSTIRLAKAHGVALGVHPGLPDLAGFGRREMQLTPQTLEDAVLYQIAAIGGIAAAEGARLRHVKLHGALYAMAAREAQVARATVRAVASFDRALVLVGPPRSRLLEAGRAEGLVVAVEGFADRAYAADGSLVPRDHPGAVLSDPEVVVARAIRIVKDGTVIAVDGSRVPMEIDTLCVHSDTPGADRLAAAVRLGLEQAGVRVAPL